MSRLRLAKDRGELQQTREGEGARLRARQGRLPAIGAQDGALAAPDQPDQHLSDDRGAHRAQTLAVAEGRRLSQDVVPERRFPLQELGILQHLDLFLARSVPDLLWGEHGY